jgi:hypothetical protein
MGHGSAITRLCGISVVYKGRVVPNGLLVVRVDIAVVPRWIYRDVAAAATYKLAQDGIGAGTPLRCTGAGRTDIAGLPQHRAATNIDRDQPAAHAILHDAIPRDQGLACQ